MPLEVLHDLAAQRAAPAVFPLVGTVEEIELPERPHIVVAERLEDLAQAFGRHPADGGLPPQQQREFACLLVAKVSRHVLAHVPANAIGKVVGLPPVLQLAAPLENELVQALGVVHEATS